MIRKYGFGRHYMVALVLAAAVSPARAGDHDACKLVTAAEYEAIIGAKADSPPGGSESTCGIMFDGYRAVAQVQVEDGFGESDDFAGLVAFWKEENANARKRGDKVEEKTVGDAYCYSTVPAFTSPSTTCLRELKGKRVLYAMMSLPSDGGQPPPVATVMKLLDTATTRAR